MAVNYVQNVIGSAAFSAMAAQRGGSAALSATELTDIENDVDSILTATHANATLAALEPGTAGSPQTQALRAAVTTALTGVVVKGASAAQLTAIATQILALYTASLAHMGSTA